MLGDERVCDVRPQRIVGGPTLGDDSKSLLLKKQPDKRHGIFAGVEDSERRLWASRGRHRLLCANMHAGRYHCSFSPAQLGWRNSCSAEPTCDPT